MTDELELEVEEVVEQKSETQVNYYSEEWQEFVLSQFHADEVKDDVPLVTGLRRLVAKLLGPIIFSGVNDLQIFGDNRASCTYRLVIDWRINVNGDRDDTLPINEVTFTAAAGCSVLNTEPPFNKYPEAIADVRAEARAYRKALRLNTPSYEEMSAEERETHVEGTINFNQKAFITNKCSQLGISLEKFLEENNYKDLNSLTRDQAHILIRKINQFQTDRVQVNDSIKEKKE